MVFDTGVIDLTLEGAGALLATKGPRATGCQAFLGQVIMRRTKSEHENSRNVQTERGRMATVRRSSSSEASAPMDSDRQEAYVEPRRCPMAAVAFDTYKMIKRLRESGFTDT